MWSARSRSPSYWPVLISTGNSRRPRGLRARGHAQGDGPGVHDRRRSGRAAARHPTRTRRPLRRGSRCVETTSSRSRWSGDEGVRDRRLGVHRGVAVESDGTRWRPDRLGSSGSCRRSLSSLIAQKVFAALGPRGVRSPMPRRNSSAWYMKPVPQIRAMRPHTSGLLCEILLYLKAARASSQVHASSRLVGTSMPAARPCPYSRARARPAGCPRSRPCCPSCARRASRAGCRRTSLREVVVQARAPLEARFCVHGPS